MVVKKRFNGGVVEFRELDPDSAQLARAVYQVKNGDPIVGLHQLLSELVRTGAAEEKPNYLSTE